MRFLHERIPKSKREEIISNYLSGDNSYDELGDYYGVNPATIRTWVSRYRKSKNVVSLHSQPKVSEDMSRDKKADPQYSGIAQLQARTMELIN